MLGKSFILALAALSGLVAASPVSGVSPEKASRSVALNSLGGVGAEIPDFQSSTISGLRCSTNADCLAKGQPVMKPRRRARNRTLQPRQSSAPPITGTVVIATNSAGVDVGYFGATGNYYSLTTDVTQALRLSIPVDTENADFTITSGGSPGFPTLGIVWFSGESYGNFPPTGVSYSMLVGTTSPVPRGVGQEQANTFTNGPVQTALWTASSGGDITVSWVNGDPYADQPATQFFYDEIANYVGISGDVAAFSAAWSGEKIIPVTLRYAVV